MLPIPSLKKMNEKALLRAKKKYCLEFFNYCKNDYNLAKNSKILARSIFLAPPILVR